MAWPGAKAGETWKYTWKTNHAPTSIGVSSLLLGSAGGTMADQVGGVSRRISTIFGRSSVGTLVVVSSSLASLYHRRAPS